MKALRRKLRIGLVGLGQRGADALHTLTLIPGVKVAAICDFYEDRCKLQMDWLKGNCKCRPPEIFFGHAGWKELCNLDLDIVYNATPWALHVPISLYAMEHGKDVAVEVPAAFTVEDCWALVETAERTHRQCMQLENCCYGETELLTLQLIRAGMFGELKHAGCAYIHDLRKWCYDDLVMNDITYGKTGYFDHWRLKWNEMHSGNQYPTHGLMPVCRYFDINRTDRLDYLVSLESQSCGFADYASCSRRTSAGDLQSMGHGARGRSISMGDVNTTLIKTRLGRSILVQHDVASPRPYSRINQLVGTRGILEGYPLRMAFADKPGGEAHKWFSSARTKRWMTKYRHPLWVEQGELAKKVGGHGGMDFLMILRLCECLKNGSPLDMDVYDLATTCCVCELSERSVRHRSASQKIPDFKRNIRNT